MTKGSYLNKKETVKDGSLVHEGKKKKKKNRIQTQANV